LNHFPFAPESN